MKRIALAYFQGVFYLINGLWPIIEIDSFMLVTGPKTDLWLVRTVGALITCTAIILLFSARKREVSQAVMLLALLNAIALTIVDVVYVSMDVIRPIYLLDAAIECLILIGWLALWPVARTSRWKLEPV